MSVLSLIYVYIRLSFSVCVSLLPFLLCFQDGEPVSKNADEFMNKADAMLADKKASSEQHKVCSMNHPTSGIGAHVAGVPT